METSRKTIQAAVGNAGTKLEQENVLSYNPGDTEASRRVLHSQLKKVFMHFDPVFVCLGEKS